MSNKIRTMAAAFACAAVSITIPAHAADVIGGFTLDTGTFGTGFGVHSNGTQAGTTINAHVNIDGSAVTFSSSDPLSITGGGEATIYPGSGGVITNLNVDFAKGWNYITFDFQKASGSFTMLVNGTTLFSGCSLCQFDEKGANKFTLGGNGITSLAFTFDPGIGSAKQFRVEGVSLGVPEASTWAMMMLGVGVLGMALRRRNAIRTAVAYT